MRRWLWAGLLVLVLSAAGCSANTSKKQSEQPGKMDQEPADTNKQSPENPSEGILPEQENEEKNKEPTTETEANKTMQETGKYAKYADFGQQKLYENYWNRNERSVYNTYPNSDQEETALNYWWKAHAADAMIDGYQRTGEEEYAKRAEEIIKNIISRNGSLYNEFYDDMEWLALACLRLYDLNGNEKMKNYSIKLWNDIKTAWWEDETGGLAWKKDEARINRNACSNGPAAILAARLYARFGDEEDLAWAKKIYAFETANLVEPETGMVFDGLTVSETGEKNVNRDWLFTYNAGTYIGAGVELYKITKDPSYLAQAKKTAASSMEAFTTVYGVTKNEGLKDGGMFKGIYIRYLELLYQTGEAPEIGDYIQKNADLLIEKGTAPDLGLFGPDWNKIPQPPMDVTCQLSGVFLLEAAARIEEQTNN